MVSAAVVEDPMYPKMVFASSMRVFHFFRFRSSICIDDWNDSIIALSSPAPTVPNEGVSPAERIFSLSVRLV